jgi:hypothetical protein
MQAGWPKGVSRSAETKSKISAALLGRKTRPCPAETREKIRLATLGRVGGMTGKKRTEEFKEHMRHAMIGKNTGKKRSAAYKKQSSRDTIARIVAVRSSGGVWPVPNKTWFNTKPELFVEELLISVGVTCVKQKTLFW